MFYKTLNYVFLFLDGTLDYTKQIVFCRLKTKGWKKPQRSITSYLFAEMPHCVEIEGLRFFIVQLYEIFKEVVI